MKTRRTTWQVNDTGNAYRPKHRRMATTDANRHNRHRERQLLFQDMQEEMNGFTGSRVVRGTPHNPDSKRSRRITWEITNRPQFMEVYDGTSDYLVECDVMEKLTGVQSPYYARKAKAS